MVIPAGDEAKTMKCPICKETMRSEYLEDEEEWVWKNAISAKGKVRHCSTIGLNVVLMQVSPCRSITLLVMPTPWLPTSPVSDTMEWPPGEVARPRPMP